MLFGKVIVVDNEENEIIYITNVKTDDFETNYNKEILDLAYRNKY